MPMRVRPFAGIVFGAVMTCLLVWWRSHPLDLSGWYACVAHDKCPQERADRQERLDRLFREQAERAERLRRLSASRPPVEDR